MVGSNSLPPDNRNKLPDLNTVAICSDDDDHDSQIGDGCDSVHATEETSTESGTIPKRSILIDLNTIPTEEPEDNGDYLDGDPGPVEANNGIRRRKRKTKMTDELKQLIYEALLERTLYGRLKADAAKEVAELFSVHLRTVQRIWKIAKDTPFGEPVNVCRRR